MNELNLCFNHLTEIPDVHEWSPGLTVLDVSNNKLTTLPLDVVAVSIRKLNLSHNKFRTVPRCVCSFTSLQYLNISYNPDILSLPVEMGRLSNLNKFLIEGLRNLKDPPRSVQNDARECIRYLNSKLRSARKFYRMKLMLVGKQNRGKTTLVARLQGLDVGINQSTVGVDVSEWHYAGGLGKKKYQFSIWDFGGQEEYYATHQCFLSERSMYLLLWNVKHGEKGIAELKPWLDNIALRAPRSCVLIVGTHLDEVEEEERPMIDELLGKVAELASDYQNKLVIPEMLAVGLMNRLENIGTLREAIYNQASEYKGKGSIPVMGQEIPASYFKLNKELEKVQEEVHKGNKDPVMHVEQFKNLVQELKLPDICSDDELRTATLFLNEVGTILHYDDRSNRINELYFIDPQWLCKMMSEIVTVRERNPFVKNGILHSRDVPFLFRDPRFPWQYFERYLTLLDRFEIALPLDNRRILIPSMLPDERPVDADIPDDKLAPLYFRFIIFSSPTPPGFWSRLISRVMHTVPHVCQALDALADQPDDDPSDGRGEPEPESINSSITDEMSAQQVSISSPIQSPPNEVPFLLPNIKRFIVVEEYEEPLDLSQFKLRYWKEGVVYQGPDVSFAIESLKQSKVYIKTKKRDGIIIMSSPTGKGTKVFCQLVDIILSLIHEWYPGLEESISTKGVEQRVPCYECRKLGRANPFEFKIDQYMSLITSNRPQIECGYERDPNKNHKVALTDIMPDLLLQDLDAEFLLKADEIKYQEDQDSLLGEGGFGKVYRGKCRGKSVAIKKYLTRIEDAFNELRSEAKVLQKSHHPCLVCLVGVSVYPLMALVLEEAPMGSLERHLLKKSTPVPRLVMFRIAAQVAAALRFLHQHGIIFRDLKAANVLVWSLDEASLCHSKVTDFGIATHLSPVGVLGIQGTKGFIAPEVFFIGKKKGIYNHKADIFSFGMLLYQMIARRHPFHNVQPVKIDTKVVQGDRPSIVDTPMAETGYFYLTRLMERCWVDKPDERPETSDLIVQVSNVIFQSVMGIHPVRSRFSLRRGCAITPHDYAKANVTSQTNSELWICCDGSEGAELNIYNTNRMVKLSKNFIKENQVQCMCVCGDHVWVCSRVGIEYGVIDIFSMISRELVHNIRMRENAVSCITCSDTVVYLGTLEGYCFAFDMDIKAIQSNFCPKYRYISEHAIDGIIVTKKHVWVSHTRFMSFLNLDTLQLKHSYERSQRMDAFIGHLAMSTHEDKCIVWSSHLGGCTLSAWDAETETHLYDIDVREVLLKDVGIGDCSEHDAIMTCMTPAMDTVWVGMATGHILLFHKQELMIHVRPYVEFIRVLIPVPCEGPCQKEKCMVVSGAEGFQSPLPGYSAELLDKDEEPSFDKSGVMILWEAYSGETLRQMRTLQESPNYLNNHKTVARIVKNLHFKDDTHILEDLTKSEQETESEEAPLIEESLTPFCPDRSALTSITGPMESHSYEIDSQGLQEVMHGRHGQSQLTIQPPQLSTSTSYELQEKDTEIQRLTQQLQTINKELRDTKQQQIDVTRALQEDLHAKERQLQQLHRELEEKQQTQVALCQERDDIERNLHRQVLDLQQANVTLQQQIQQLQEQSHWVVRREEIEMTEEVLGKGSWGEVKVAKFRGLRVAAKCIHEVILSPYNMSIFTREMEIAARVRHPNLLQFIGATRVGTPIILSELMPTSLRQELEKSSLTSLQIIKIARDISAALNYLHLWQPHSILHRDVSSPNVLLEPSGRGTWKAKLSDYGSANLVQSISAGSVAPGNPFYAAPEAQYPDHHSPAMDVFSFGALLMEMILHQPPASKTADKMIQSETIQWPSMKSLVQRCISRESRNRPSISQVLIELEQM